MADIIRPKIEPETWRRLNRLRERPTESIDDIIKWLLDEAESDG